MLFRTLTGTATNRTNLQNGKLARTKLLSLPGNRIESTPKKTSADLGSSKSAKRWAGTMFECNHWLATEAADAAWKDRGLKTTKLEKREAR